MAPATPPHAPVVNFKGFVVIPEGSNTPTFEVNRDGDGYFAGSLRVDGQIQMTGGGTSGTVLGNNEYVSGLTTSAAVKRLIGVSSGDVVSLDADAIGIVTGGALTVTGVLYAPLRVGIGTTIPSVDLEITKATDAAAIIRSTASGTTYIQIDKFAAGNNGFVEFSTANAAKFRAGLMGDNNWTLVDVTGTVNAIVVTNNSGAVTMPTSLSLGVTTNATGLLYQGGNAALAHNLDVAGTAALCGDIAFRKSNGTQAARTIVADGDTLGTLTAFGCATTGTFASASQIVFKVDGVPGASADMPGRIEFYTSPDGSATPTLSLRLSANKAAVFIGTVTAPAYVVGAQAGANGTFANVTVVHGIVVSGT